jgi:phosphate transport system substrate-binding protein
MTPRMTSRTGFDRTAGSIDRQRKATMHTNRRVSDTIAGRTPRRGPVAPSARLRRTAVLVTASLAAMVGIVGFGGVASADTTSPTVVVSPLVTAPASTGSAATNPASGTSTTTTPPSTVPNKAISHAGAGLDGTGSSFAAPAIETFQQQVQAAPYNLNVNYSSTSSGDGRYEFTNGTTDFAVSDIAYGLGNVDTTPPSFPYIYVPITAGGIAFMYNIPGLSKTLQLNSYTTCAIMTGGIQNWDDPHIAQQNPGVSLPNLPIRPVTESDPAGTNYVLEEYCIQEQPAIWSAFANFENSQPGLNVVINATSPESEWPALQNGLDADSTAAVASSVSTNSGAIGGVQLQYAVDAGFDKGDPSRAVASEQNASGDYAQPSSVDVASALAYATQLPNGTHKLDFGGLGPHVYNPSTYSYLLTPTSGWSKSKGAVMSAFVNYALTIGQEKSPSIGYASLGLSLERYGVNAVTADVPGAVKTTAAEAAAYACGDLTPAEVAAGQTTPTCGVLNSNDQAPIPPGSGVNGVGGAGGGGAGGAGAGGAGGLDGANGVGGAGGAGGLDPAVSLSGSSPLAFTGGDPRPLVVVGVLLLAAGWYGRLRWTRRRRAGSAR